MRIELGEDVLAHFQFVNASQDNQTQMYGVLAADGDGGAALRKFLDEHVLTRCARAFELTTRGRLFLVPLSLYLSWFSFHSHACLAKSPTPLSLSSLRQVRALHAQAPLRVARPRHHGVGPRRRRVE